MLKGSIEAVTSERVSGWVYSSAVDLQGRTVLAFRGAECIGAGTISIFRPDLREAGLGHGCFGYDFEISASPFDDRSDVYVRLDDCQAIFVQSNASLVSTSENRRAPIPNHVAPMINPAREPMIENRAS